MPRPFEPRAFSGEISTALQMAIARVLELAAIGMDERFGRVSPEAIETDSSCIGMVSDFIGFEEDHETPTIFD